MLERVRNQFVDTVLSISQTFYCWYQRENKSIADGPANSPREVISTEQIPTEH